MTTLISGVEGDAAERRRYVLHAHQSVLATYASAATGDGDGSRLAEELFWAGERLREEYLDLLPTVPLSRCPWTDEVLSIPIDTYDLDGLWWAYQTPLRELGTRPPSFIALTGAVRLGSPVPDPPFLVKPGPEAPYVLPRLLEDDHVHAVVSQIPIGPHTGFALTYFSDTPDDTIGRANEWGSNGFRRLNADGSLEWGAVPEDPSEFDFSLGPWIEQGRVHWIAPGDTAMQLRTGVPRCPYIDLPGRREIVRFGEGARP